ncbi:lipase chaperone [Vibrio cholerae]|uniref:lipase secretion chaperone n=1 Tax=Vibrio cholerae TaxID=666 RepID=UPI0011D6F9F4|nr:lipase secretion chaperone [Vibrio cholerae]EGR2464894.1 lipase chaperone [Vibrio cholerae]TXZ15104.1 lipase chaperone [Vibrio cholerae]GHX54732.1 lipase activator protein, putative [Vibrio cholerae]
MKKIAWSLGIVVIIGALCAVVWPSWYPSQPLVTTPSQADIQADQSSPRDLLEYFLSGLGETSLPVIQQQVQRYEQESQGLLIDSSLFAQYVQYKAALSELTLPQASGGLSTQEWWQLHQSLLDLQARYFSAEQQALLVEQPDFIQRSEATAQLLPQLTQAGQGDAQQRYLARVALVGEQGAQRLAELDDSRATFEQQFQDYYQARAAILVHNELSASEQQTQIQQLREQHFAPEQWRRIDALERLKDNGE